LFGCHLVWLPGFQRLLVALEQNKKWFQLLFGQWDHNITQGWFLALHQTLDAGAIQWHFHNF
jgi:hypothetical protein